jgi:triphosphoribosyl-dephospho-CoA synthase
MNWDRLALRAELQSSAMPRGCPFGAVLSAHIATLAVRALVDEAELTPKPGLVDRRGSGAHEDLNLGLMLCSAKALAPGFLKMSQAGLDGQLGVALRETLGRLGREAEQAMMVATAGVNTHRGAIWALGLLCAAAGLRPDDWDARAVAGRAAALAQLPDCHGQPGASNGEKVRARYGVPGARGEAQQGFPHVIDIGLPALRASRAAGHAENTARIDALIAIIARLPDTCVLSRGGQVALNEVQALAGAVIEHGGVGTLGGRRALQHLEQSMLSHNASPGGAADLLAATLLLDALEQRSVL